MKKVIIDTDLGDDIDDVLAIALAVKSPELDVIGITTVYKNTGYRAELALKLLKLFGRDDINVVKGLGMPFMNKVDCSEIPCQYGAVEDSLGYNNDIDAVDFIIKKVNNIPDITIVAIGPLTNIAAAIIKEPETAKRASLVVMGGMISIPYPEGNINSDPEAARIVFDSGIPITMVGLDITLKCSLNEDQVKLIIQSDKMELKFLSKLLEYWKKEFLFKIFMSWGMKYDEINYVPCPTLHDPLAVGFLIDPALFKTTPVNIKIETKGQYTRGVTMNSINVFTGQSGRYNADACMDVDFDRFIKLFMDRILG